MSSSNKNRSSLLLLLLLLLGIIGVSVYAFKQKKALGELDKAHQELTAEFNSKVAELEKLQNENSGLKNSLIDRDAKIEKLKAQIRKYTVGKKSISPQELVALTRKLTELNKEVEGYKARIAELEGKVVELETANQDLNSKNQVLSTEKEQLTNTVNQAAQIKAISLDANFLKSVWFFGKSEKPTLNPKKVSKGIIKFFLQNNFLAQDGTKEIYISIVQPNGQVLQDKDDLQSGTVSIGETSVLYTHKLMVNYDKTKANEVVANFVPDTLPMQAGKYEVVVYDNTGAVISDRTHFFFSLSEQEK